jgi:hypothetical protein
MGTQGAPCEGDEERMGSHQKKRPASGAWLGAAPVLTVRDSGGAATWVELDAAIVRSAMGAPLGGVPVSLPNRGEEKKEGQVGEPSRAG